MISIVLDRVDKRAYATFQDVPAMRASVNKHIKKIQESGLSGLWQRKLIRLLDQLRDLSQQFPGLSFSSQRKLAKRLGLKKPDTVGIWLKKLADMGVVNILPAKRYYKNQQTVNFVQIVPAETETAESIKDEKKKRGLEESQKSHEIKGAKTKNGEHEFKNYLNSKTNLNTTYSRLDETFTPQNVPNSFIETVKPFFDEAGEIYKLWGKAKLAFKKFKLTYVLEDYSDLVQKAFKQTVFAHKHRKIHTDFTGYFYGTLIRMFTYQKREETFASHPFVYNWLEDTGGHKKSWRDEIQQLINSEEQNSLYDFEELPY